MLLGILHVVVVQRLVRLFLEKDLKLIIFLFLCVLQTGFGHLPYLLSSNSSRKSRSSRLNSRSKAPRDLIVFGAGMPRMRSRIKNCMWRSWSPIGGCEICVLKIKGWLKMVYYKMHTTVKRLLILKTIQKLQIGSYLNFCKIILA